MAIDETVARMAGARGSGRLPRWRLGCSMLRWCGVAESGEVQGLVASGHCEVLQIAVQVSQIRATTRSKTQDARDSLHVAAS